MTEKTGFSPIEKADWHFLSYRDDEVGAYSHCRPGLGNMTCATLSRHFIRVMRKKFDFSREGHCISGFFPAILKQKGGEADEAFECRTGEAREAHCAQAREA